MEGGIPDPGVGGIWKGGVDLSGEGPPEHLSGYRIAWNFLRVLGIEPVSGRSFLPTDEAPGGAPVALLGHGLWKRLFGSDPRVLGRTVLFDGFPVTVIGILPPRFRFEFTEPQVLLPLVVTGEEPRSSHAYSTIGRLQDGFGLVEANAELGQLEARISQAYPETSTENGARVLSMKEGLFDEGFRAGSLISTVAILFVLLIACANVANLLLARGAGREAELALRSALGAGRGRIVRQLLTESLVLAILGGIVGVFLGVLGIRGLTSILPSNFLVVEEITLNGRVLAFTAGVSLLSGILFGLAPALQAAAPNLRGALHEGSRGSTGAKGEVLRKGLVVVEMALAMVLLISSALLVQSFWRMRSVDLGIDPENVLTMWLSLPEARYPSEEDLRVFQHDLLDRLRGIPSLTAAGLSTLLPTQGFEADYYVIPSRPSPTPWMSSGPLWGFAK